MNDTELIFWLVFVLIFSRVSSTILCCVCLLVRKHTVKSRSNVFSIAGVMLAAVFPKPVGACSIACVLVFMAFSIVSSSCFWLGLMFS